MDPLLFEKCIKYISSKYTVALFEEYILKPPKVKSESDVACIMFDDGYKDNLEYAIPILEKYNVKASFYIVTNCIEKNIPTWTYILEHRFQNTSKKSLSLNSRSLPMNFWKTNFESKKAKMDFVRKLKPMLKGLPHVERTEILEEINQQFNDVELPKIMMSWEDVSNLTSYGHYVGSHTVSHPMLGNLENHTTIKEELLNSGNEIQKRLGYFPLSISYPVGSYNPEIKRFSKECGYKLGLAVQQEVYDPMKQDLFEIPRIELYNEPWWKTKMRISNRIEEIKKLLLLK